MGVDPEAELEDLSIRTVAAGTLTFVFDLIFDFLIVAIKSASGSSIPFRPTNLRVWFPEEKTRFFDVIGSIPPSDLVNEYLSSSNAKNTSSVPVLTVELSPEVLRVKVNDLLMSRLTSLTSTDSIFFFWKTL